MILLRTDANNFSNINWIHVYMKAGGQVTCARGRECSTRVKLKVAKKTTAGCCLHEAIAGLFLTPGIDTIVGSLSSIIFQTSVLRF